MNVVDVSWRCNEGMANLLLIVAGIANNVLSLRELKYDHILYLSIILAQIFQQNILFLIQSNFIYVGIH